MSDRAAFLTCAVAIHDATLRQVVWRKFDVYAVARENPNTVPAQSPSDVGQDDVAIVELDRKGCARKDLSNAPRYFEWSFLEVLGRAGFGRAWPRSSDSIASGD